jgi:hypothetical protein
MLLTKIGLLSLPIPSNIKQIWYHLVSLGNDKTSSIIANMIPVSSWYHHDVVLVVFCLSGIIMVLILAIFTNF